MNPAPFLRFLDVLLPSGGAMVAMVETYFDESEEGNWLSVSGYLFKKESAEKIAVEWPEVLRPHGIKVFHMVDLAHGLGEFEHLKKEGSMYLTNSSPESDHEPA